MTKLIVNAFVTLDGVMQAPGGPDEDREDGFTHGGWQAPYVDGSLGARITQGFEDADAFLLGRKTYDIFSNYWPKITDPANPIATALNQRPKHVASRALERVEWNNAHLIEGDVVAAIRRLRERPGRSIQTWGSTDLMQTLLRHELIDEFRIFVFPLVLGSGKRLFGAGTVPAAFTQVEAIVGANGATFHRLERAGRPTYGQIGD